MRAITLTADQLRAIAPTAGSHADAYAAPLTDACARFDIATPQRMAAFLAQIMHESGALSTVVENLNYSAAGLLGTFSTRFSPAAAAAYARKPDAIANHAYAGVNGNGDEASGDGWRFRGRGLIQVTGRANYAAIGATIGLPLLVDPGQLQEPGPAAVSAAAWWSIHHCNVLADADDFTGLTRRINGGLNGQPDRLAYWARARAVLGLPSINA